VEIDQAGHLVHEDQPEQVNRLLLGFLAPYAEVVKTRVHWSKTVACGIMATGSFSENGRADNEFLATFMKGRRNNGR